MLWEKLNKKLLHVLLTLDPLFIDELAQISAEHVGPIDVILRNLYKYQTPFGGLLILGTMDHTHVQPIN